MASNPTYKPSVYVGRVDPKKIEPLVNDKAAKEKNYPGINRVTQGVVPAGLDLEARHRARRDAGAHAAAVPVDPVHADRDVRARQAGVPQLGSVRQPADDAGRGARPLVRHLLLRGRLPVLPRGRSAAATGCRSGRGSSASASRPGSTSAASPRDSCRRPPGGRRSFKSDWDRAWNPGDSIQLSIGQKDVQVTPLQMARFYAMIANGGKLVTPYVVSQVETAAPNGQSPVVERRFAPDPPKAVGVDPAALQVVRDGLYSATHSTFGTSSGVFASFPIPIAGKTGTAEKVVQLPGLPGRPHRGPVLVVRLRAGADRGAAHRRLRRDRERRPRVDRGRAGGAAGLREVLRREGARARRW